MSEKQVSILGPIRVDYLQQDPDGLCNDDSNNPPRFRSRRTLALLGYLASEHRPVAREHLAALFWPDETTSNGRANLSRELHNLTQILPECWILDRHSVYFVTSFDTSVDIYQFLEFEEQERWLEAAELLSGEFMEGINLPDNPEFEIWLLGQREVWRGRSEAILLRVIDGQKQRGRYSNALQYTQRLLQLAPWNESAHRYAMRLLAWTGKRGAALRQFDICKNVLRDELDIEPSQETIDLYNQIYAGQLDLPKQLPAFLTDEKSRHDFVRPLFVGEEDNLAQLDAYLSDALAGRGRVIFIAGGPGRGKSALLEAFSHRAMDNHSNLLVAGSKCNAYSGLGDPYLPFRDIFTMLTGDVENRWDAGAISREHAHRLWTAFPLVIQVLLDYGPNLVGILVPETPLLSRSVIAGKDEAAWLPQLKELVTKDIRRSKEIDQNYIFNQVDAVLCNISKEQPLLLVLDDLQWGDTASISLLFHIGRCLLEMDSKILIVCAYRPEEVEIGRLGKRHPLAKPLGEFKRTFGDVWINLDKVDEGESRKFVTSLLDSEPHQLSAGFQDTLFHWTEGHPLFTVELLRAMKDRGELLKDDHGVWIEGQSLDWNHLPARVEAVIEERVDRLSPDLREILTIASVEGEIFTTEVVALVQNVSKRKLLFLLSQDLERRHRLVKEQGEIEISETRMFRFRFNHILFQNYLYKSLPPEYRRQIHGEIAAALEQLHSGNLADIASRLAQHYQQAGKNRQAYHYYALAGKQAEQMYASRETISHYTNAIQIACSESYDASTLAGLHRRRGVAYGTVGDFQNAHRDYESALQLARSAGRSRLEWRTLLDLGRLWASRDNDKALVYFESSLQKASQMGEQKLLAGSLNWLGNWCANNENPKMAIKYHQEALLLFEDREDAHEITNTLDLLGLAYLLAGNYMKSVDCYNRAISLCRKLDNQPRLVSCLIGRATTVSGLVYLASTPATPSINASKNIEEALQIAKELNLVADETWAHWSLGLLFIVHGKFESAFKTLNRGLHIAEEIEHREWLLGNQFALGIMYCELFSPEQALEHLNHSFGLAEELNSPVWIHLVSGALAKAYYMIDDFNAAQSCLEAVITPRTPMETIGKRYCWVRSSEIALFRREPDISYEITNDLISSASGISSESVITYLWILKGEAAAALKNKTEAYTLFSEALENAYLNEEIFLLSRIHTNLGQLYKATGHHVKARREFSKASRVIDQVASSIDDQDLKEKFLNGAYRVIRTLE